MNNPVSGGHRPPLHFPAKNEVMSSSYLLPRLKPFANGLLAECHQARSYWLRS